MNRIHETSKLAVGQKVTYGEFPGTVTKLYDDGPYEGARMYEVRLPGGVACVCGSDLIPVPNSYLSGIYRQRQHVHEMAERARKQHGWST